MQLFGVIHEFRECGRLTDESDKDVETPRDNTEDSDGYIQKDGVAV